jgi:hypothetical protein
MSAVYLARIDPARNMRRFYRLDVQPDLFGGFAVMKEWGRIGARGGAWLTNGTRPKLWPPRRCSAMPNANAGADISELSRDEF